MMASVQESYHSYWGKSGHGESDGHLLCYHGLDASAVAKVWLEDDRLLRRRLALVAGLSESLVVPLTAFFIGLHDAGKFSEGFQGLRPDLVRRLNGPTGRTPYPHRHDYLSGLAWRESLLPNWVSRGWFGMTEAINPRDLLRPWALTSAGHHGRPSGLKPFAGRFKDFFTPGDRAALLAYAEALVRLLEPEARPGQWPRDPEQWRRASWLLAGLAIVCDWLASNSELFSYRLDPVPMEIYWVQARQQAESALADSGLLPGRPSLETGLARLWPALARPTPLQRFVEECPLDSGPRLFIIEEATGGGKTEAAITLAHRLMCAGQGHGLFIGLPTMATANAMYGRLIKAYRRLFAENESVSLVLAHGSRGVNEVFRRSLIRIGPGLARLYRPDEETAEAECSLWLADNRKKSLLASVGVGTVDQAVLGVLPVRHQALRLLGLARNVLILDEVHAYDEYLAELIRGLLEFMAGLGGSVILLSATLPRSARQRYVDRFAGQLAGSWGVTSALGESGFPLVTQVTAGRPAIERVVARRQGSSRRVRVEIRSRVEEIEERLLTVIRSGGCACWIRNTVDDALEAHDRLLGRVEPERLGLFHARLALGDRLTIENDVLQWFGPSGGPADRAGRLLIATQVVEQSLDLDFDFLVTDLAPMDLIVQRAGRLHRHARPLRPLTEPALVVFGPAPAGVPKRNWYEEFFPRGAYVYPRHGRLWLTARLLAERGCLDLPEASRDLIEGVYGPEAEDHIPAALADRDLKAEGEARARLSLAWQNSLKPDSGYTAEGVAWEEDTPTRLGLPETTIFLARWEKDRLAPWAAGEGSQAWPLSQVRVRRSKVFKEADPDDPVRREALESARVNLPGNGRDALLLALEPGPEESWTGLAWNESGKPVRLVYHPRRGLSVQVMASK
ncbi:MAG: CRISPR-associated helicase Cas3' [Thermodesulfobacteriota bacterium]